MFKRKNVCYYRGTEVGEFCINGKKRQTADNN